MRGQDLTQGNIPKQIWSLAWPIILSFFFQTLYNFVDAIWVGQLQEEAIAAVAISQVSLFIMISIGLGITVGSGVLISMNIGMKNKPEAERILGQAFVLAAIVASIFTFFSLIFRREILVATGAGGTIFPLALDYFTIIAAGSVLIFQLIVIVFGFNSQGDNKTVTILFLISSVINAVLDPLFIFGIPGIGLAGMGIQGAAIATLISQAVMLVIGIKILSNPKMMIQFHWKNLVAKWESVRKVFNIGLPAAATQILNPTLFAILTVIIKEVFAEPGNVGFSVGFRVENFAFLPGIGFGTAAMAMIGQNVGARNIERTRKAHRKTQLFAFIAGSIVGVISIVLSNPIISLLGVNDTVSQGYASSYLLMVPFTYGILAMLFVNVSTVQATGRSWPGFFIYLTQFIFIGAGALIITLGLQLPLWALWIVMIAGRITALMVSEIAVRGRFKSLELEFQTSPAPAWGGPGGPGGPGASSPDHTQSAQAKAEGVTESVSDEEDKELVVAGEK
jgi:putative MATE family efflux protein